MNDKTTVPGEFSCPQCGFVVIKSIINPATGQTGRDAADRLETCPNDGTILRPVLYADALTEARKDACKAMRQLRIAEQMEVLLHNLVVRGRLSGHELQAAKNILGDWQEGLSEKP
jgi:hypothetical protein